MNTTLQSASPSYRAKRGRAPVTIAIGFSFQNGLFFASDSQMSFGPKYKQWDEPKISPVRFQGGQYAILAISGSLDGARCFHDIFEPLAAATNVVDARSIANAGETAVKQARSKLLAYINDPTTTAEERKEHLDAHDFEALLGYFHGSPAQPYIYRIKLGNGIAVRGRHSFEAIGCGSDVAGFILTGGDFTKMHEDEAISLAVYVVEMCKKFDQACGGPVQQMYLSSNPTELPRAFGKERMGFVLDAVSEETDTIHSTITQIITSKVGDAYLEMQQEEFERMSEEKKQ